MKRLSKQQNLLNYSQFIIALFFVLDVVLCAKIAKVQDSNQENEQDLNKHFASILTNHDSEAILRNPISNENKFSNQQQTNLQNESNKAKIVKRSPRAYNFGLGKKRASLAADKLAPVYQMTDEQIKELLNYLHNLDLNVVSNYISSLLNEGEMMQQQQENQLGKYPIYEPEDDDQQDLANQEKYNVKRDAVQRYSKFNFGLGKREPKAQRQNYYNFGIGKRYNMGGFGMSPQRTEEFYKRRYSFGIGKRSAD